MRRLCNLAALASALAVVFAVPVWAAAGDDDDDVIEEIVVTGSYIRRADTFDSASPLRTIDELYILEQGTSEIAYVILDLPYNMGSNIRQGLQGGNLGGFGNVNLRGLGFSATLPLVNGRRVVYENVNHFAPGIAIQRIETLLDGASALYGSDAVAGVINFITRDDFEGFEFRYNTQFDDDTGDINDHNLSFIVGGEFDRGHFMMAYEWFKRDAWELASRDLPNAGDSFFGKSYQLPQWFLCGLLSAASPACGVDPAVVRAYTGTDQAVLTAPFYAETNFGFAQDLNCADDPGGLPNRSGIACGFNYSLFFPVTTREDRKVAMVSFTYELSDNVEFYGSYNIARAYSDNLQSDYPWTSFTPIIPEYNPGLVEDARRRGIPAGTPLVPLQFFGRKVMGVPRQQLSNPEERHDFGQGKVKQNNDRLVVGLQGDLTFTDTWSYDAAFTWGFWENSYEFHDTIRSNILLALQGLGGTTCNTLDATNIANAQMGLSNVNDSGCFFYNPFLNSQYTETGAVQTDPDLVNNWREIMLWLDGQLLANQELPYWTYDIVATGDIFEIDGRPVGLALGAQYIYREENLIYDNDREDGNYAFTGAENSYERNRTVWGVFAELAIPILDNVDVQLAVRHERYTEEELDSTDPKIAVVWSVLPELNLRASFSTSFRAPSIAQLNPDEVDVNFQNAVDPASQGATFYVPIRVTGNPNLVAQEADVWNVGGSWRPTEGWLANFEVDIDYFSVDYTDLVVAEPYQDIIDADPCSQAVPAPPGTVCDPRVIRGPGGLIVAVEPSYLNAGGTVQEGIDFNFAYTWFTDNYGQFRVGVQGIYFLTMDMELYDAGCQCVNDIEGIGNRNHDNPFGPIQEIKTNTAFNWSMGRHRASIIWRHLDEYTNSGQGTSSITTRLENERGYSCIINGVRNTGGTGCPIEAQDTFDVQYAYEIPSIWGLDSGGTVTVGAINVTDEDPPVVAKDMGFDQQSHDARGRLWYARYQISL